MDIAKPFVDEVDLFKKGDQRINSMVAEGSSSRKRNLFPMKMCDECGQGPANIHLTQIMGTEAQSFHLCETCAEKRGIHIAIDESAVAASMNSASAQEDRECPVCNTRLSEFRTTGWLGCAACYDTFDREIADLLVNLHGSSEHKGKKYGPPLVEEKRGGNISQLRHELDTAIANEEFERAALLRDTIQNLCNAKVR